MLRLPNRWLQFGRPLQLSQPPQPTQRRQSPPRRLLQRSWVSKPGQQARYGWLQLAPMTRDPNPQPELLGSSSE